MRTIINNYRCIPLQIKASFWFLICSFMQKGISIITTPIFTRILSTIEYGQYGVFNSWLSIVTVFVTINMYSGMYTRGLIKYSNERYVFSSTLQGLSLILVVVWTSIYSVFHTEINQITSLSTVQMLSMLLMIWATAAFSFWAAEQRVNLNYKSLVILTIIASVAKPIIGIVFVLLAEDKVTARILGLALVELIIYVGCFIVQIKRGGKFYSKKYWKEALFFNIPLIPHYLSLSILNSADKIMIEKMIGLSEAGIYSLAYSLSQIMKLFNTALTQTIEPWLYKQINNNRINEIGKVAYPSWVLIAIVNLTLIAFAPEAVAVFAPKSYHEAIWVIPPIAMSVFFIFLYSFFAVFEFYYAKTKLVAIATCAGAVLNIILNYVFIKIFGYYAAGYTTLACYMVYAVMHYLFMRKICKEELIATNVYDIRILLGITAAFIIIGFFLLMTYNYRLIRYNFILIIVIILLINRKKISEFLKKLVKIKGNKS